MSPSFCDSLAVERELSKEDPLRNRRRNLKLHASQTSSRGVTIVSGAEWLQALRYHH